MIVVPEYVLEFNATRSLMDICLYRLQRETRFKKNKTLIKHEQILLTKRYFLDDWWDRDTGKVEKHPVESDKTTSIYNVSTRVLSKK